MAIHRPQNKGDTYIISDEPFITDLGGEEIGDYSFPVAIKLDSGIHIVVDDREGLVWVTRTERQRESGRRRVGLMLVGW